MIRRLTASSWPPLVALAVALVVFAVVLRSTPAGLSAVPRFFLGQTSGLGGLPAAYALGAASVLALLALLVVGLTCALLDVAIRALRARSGRRAGANGPDGPSG